MTRARDVSKLAHPEAFSVDSDNRIGLGTVTPDAKFDVIGVVSATSFRGDGSNLTGIIAGATLSASSGTQRLVVTSQTTGALLNAATSSDLTYNTSTSTVSASQYSGTLSGNATGLTGTPSITVQDLSAEQVSVAGTLSYGSVDNVNSIGRVTANKGLKVTGHLNVTGVVTATSFSGSGAQLSNVNVGTQSFVASGTIPNGATVVINTDGTVGVVTSSVTTSNGSYTQFTTNSSLEADSVYDPDNGKVVVVYSDNGNNNKGTVVVGSVSGTTITFGTPAVYTGSYAGNRNRVCYDTTNDRIVIAYLTNVGAFELRTIVGTVNSNNTVSFGSPVTVLSARGDFFGISYASTPNRVLLSYADYSNNSYGTIKAGQVNSSNNSISFGSALVFYSGAILTSRNIYEPNSGKILIFYRVDSDGSGRCALATISGSSMTLGNATQFTSGIQYMSDPVLNTDQNSVLISWRDTSNSSKGTIICGKVSGSSISFGSAQVYKSSAVTYQSLAIDSNNVTYIVYEGNNGCEYTTATVSNNTTITIGSIVVDTGIDGNYDETTYDSVNDKIVHTNFNNGGRSFVITPLSTSTNLTSGNYIGIAATTIGSGQSGSITVVGGVNNSQSGLTTARKYYIQKDGTVGLTADTPSVIAGTSISSTQIVVQKS